MAKAIKKNLGIEAEFIKSGNGVFEIEADGNLVFSKKQKFRFPDNEEIIAALKQMM